MKLSPPSLILPRSTLVTWKRTSQALTTDLAEPNLEDRASRAMAVSDRAARAAFEPESPGAWSAFSSPHVRPRPAGPALSGLAVAGLGSINRALPLPAASAGSRPASELSPFDARTIPSSRERARAATQAEVEGKGATTATRPLRDSRLGEIRAEADGAVGNFTGPEEQMGAVGDLGDVARAAAAGAAGGAARGAVGGGGLVGAAAGALGGAVAGAASELMKELWDAGSSVIKDAEEARRREAQRGEPRKNEPNTPDDGKDAGVAPPTEADKKEPPAPDGGTEAPAPPEKESADGPDPMRGSGRHYEAYRQAYLGHADGTPFGARGTSKEGGAASPRNTNPGRDRGGGEGPSENTTTPSTADLALVADPMRGPRMDARAAGLMNMTRVGGRVVLTDPNAEDEGVGKPKGSGLE